MSRKVALCGIYVALAFIFSYLESMLSFGISVPGVKIGLANIVVIVALYTSGKKDAVIVNLVRVVLAGFIFGSGMSILYSLSGAVTSLTVMLVMKKTDLFSIKGVSIAGGVVHNMAQILLAVCILETRGIMYYLPVLVIAGAISGIVVGVLGEIICNKIRKSIHLYE